MAIISTDSLLHGASGRFGDLVLRYSNGRTIVCQRPRRGQPQPSATQLAIRERFKAASRYATEAMRDPVLNAEFTAAAEAGGNSKLPRNLAMADYYKKPSFGKWSLERARMKDKPAVILKISVRDQRRITGVIAVLIDPAGKVQKATPLLRSKGSTWLLKLDPADVEANAQLALTATDRAGNEVEETISL